MGGGWGRGEHRSPGREQGPPPLPVQQLLPHRRVPSRSRSPAEQRRAAAGGGVGPDREAQLVPFRCRGGEAEFELIGRQLLLSGLPRSWQRDERRIQELVESTGAKGEA